MALVKGGVPDGTASWDVVKTGDLTVYVPRDKEYKTDIPRIVHLRKNGNDWVGVVNER